MASTTQHQLLAHFVEAMKAVYGPFDRITTPEAAARFAFPSHPGAGGHRGRYLWTDAFGVVNFVTLSRQASPSLPSSSDVYLALAKRLVHAVHDTLGRTRDGASRLPRATDQEPLKGGLRIGKPAAAGPDADGQYHHYLTLWMFALNRLAVAARDRRYNDLAVQLARAVHPHFLVRGGGGPPTSMVWKVSTDLDEVLVPSEGALDAVTGYVVFRLLQRTAARLGGGEQGSRAGGDDGVLSSEINDYKHLMEHGGRLRPRASRDPLDLGMGLWTCHWAPREPWAAAMAEAGLASARSVMDETRGVVARDPSRRLSFRELGACMGLRCVVGPGDALKERADAVVDFWRRHLDETTEEDLRPISKVMLAAAMVPGAWKNDSLADE
ncbi:hypothetical protein VTJ83DRAFT_2619 [Remersonia thermophila]|uniref:Uncharacterized protein n=1 Tax=Remersonia thermophila TaxID=72144 RepID=A0ABR4DJV4_9PEZI